MNKKFTMMLAAFVAAGYTITAEAGVVKVSKPEAGQAYFITNVLSDGENLYSLNPGAKNDDYVTSKEVQFSDLSSQTKWTLKGADLNSIQLEDPSGRSLKNDVTGYRSHTMSPVTFSITEQNQITHTVSDATHYLTFPATEGNITHSTTISAVSFYKETTDLTTQSAAALKFGALYLVLDGQTIKLVEDDEYYKYATKWEITADSKIKVASNAGVSVRSQNEYLKIANEELSLVDESSASVISELDGKLLVANVGEASLYVTIEDGLLSLCEDDELSGKTQVSSSVSDPATGLTLPTIGDFDSEKESYISDWTDENVSTFTLAVRNSANSKTYLKAKDGKVVSVGNEEISGSAYFWKIDEDGKITCADGTPFALDGGYQYELVSAGVSGVYYLRSVKGDCFVKYVDGSGLEKANNAGEASAFVAESSAYTSVDGNVITNQAQGEFSLTYKIDNKEVPNLFSGVTAIYVNGVDNYEQGTYFVVDAPDNLDLTYTSSSDDSKLNKLTFVAVSPIKSDNFVYQNNNADKGAGYTLTTVKGEDLVSGNGDNNKISHKNVAFNVYRSMSNPDRFTVRTLASFYINNSETGNLTEVNVGNGLLVTAVKGKNGSTFVATFNSLADGKFDYASYATLTPATAVKYSDFLGTEAKIYNIQFLSTTAAPASATTSEAKETYSECNKYLGAGEAANEFLAQGADFVDLSLPQNQWVVSNMTEDNVVTFTNRETAKSFSAKLIKIADNEYRLAGFTSDSDVKYLYLNTNDEKVISTDLVYDNDDAEVNNFIVKLTSVTASKNDGYVSGALSENDMVKIAFTPTSSVVVNDLYLTISGTTPKTGLNVEGAAEFEVVKTAQKTKTAAHVTPIAVLKDGKPAVSTTVADTLNVVTYAFKYVKGDDTYFLTNDASFGVEKKEEAKNNNQFIIKKLNNGKLALIAYVNNDSDKDFDESITSVRKAFDANLESSTVRFNYNHNLYSAAADPQTYISFVGQDAAISLPAKSQHVLFNNEGAYMAVNENNAAVIDGPSELKAEYTKEQLTFWLDTTDSEAIVPTFYITKGSKQFMFNAADSLKRYNEGTASLEEVKAYMMPDYQTSGAARAIFRAATLKDSNTLTTSIKGESKDLTAEKGIEAYQYQIVLKDKAVADEYVVRSLVEGKPYLYESNGALGFTDDAKKAIVFNIESTEAPTSNEGVSASDVKVVAQNGSVVVMNAAGKNVVVSTILGQVVVNEVLTSDNATINVPAGIVVVAVEGESFKVNVK